MFGIGGPEVVTLVLTVLVLILAVLAVLMPVFVYQVRNRCQSMDKKMDVIVELLGGSKQTISNKLVKVCPFCKTKNRAFDHVCINCGKAMGI